MKDTVPAALAAQLEQLAPDCDVTVVTVVTGSLLDHRKRPCPDTADWVGALTEIGGTHVHMWALCTRHRDDLTEHFGRPPSAEWLRFTSKPLRRHTT